jgi:molybdopterin-guanine dinucleotide biosynthesis protein A
VDWCGDALPGLGPMGGIITALRRLDGKGQSICVVACDMPAVCGELLDTLLANRKTDAPATVFQTPNGLLEPLVGVYEAPALESLEEAARSQKLQMQEWLRSAGAHCLRAPDGLASQLVNVNTPEDLDALKNRQE